VTIKNNTAYEYGGGIYVYGSTYLYFSWENRCNIYSNTVSSNRGYGYDLYSNTYNLNEVIVDTFTVMNPSDYFASPISDFTFDIQHCIIEQVNADLYVSPSGDNLNSGLSASEPMKTIEFALLKIYTDNLTTHTIHLAEGVYSPETNEEVFPIQWKSYVNLSGSGEATTILDADSTAGVMEFISVSDVLIEYVTITNGSAEQGGGIYCFESSPNLENVTISNNSATGTYGSGGGIYCADNSGPNLENVRISDNNATSCGGGIYCIYDSNLSFNNVIISDNIAFIRGGGIYCYGSDLSLANVRVTSNSTSSYGGGIYCNYSETTLENVTVSNNSASDYGAGILCKNSSLSFSMENRCNIYSNITSFTRGYGADIFTSDCGTIAVVVDTFTVMTPTDYYASPIDNISFDILNCTIDNLINADVYVSTDGSDSNSGISPGTPFKTIQHALEMIYTDSLITHTIHLVEGVYSPATNGEVFPIHWSSFVNLSGSEDGTTVIDADGTASVFVFRFVYETLIENITITNGSSNAGGGILCSDSDLSLENVIISNNSANGDHGNGGGIYFRDSNASLENVRISNNSATEVGGGICCSSSDPVLSNVIIRNNSADDNGGGIYCYGNSIPNLLNVIVSDNFAVDGGGMYFRYSCPSLTNSIISNNSASDDGGGIYYGDSETSFINSTIINNSASEDGGGIYCYASSTSFINSIISNNSTSDDGGGLYCYASNTSLLNSTISNNTSDDGGGLYCRESSNSNLINNILWNNTPQGIYFYQIHGSNSVTSSYSNIQGGEAGIETNNNGEINWLEGNIDSDPLFIGTGEHPFTLSVNSPCIDAGTPDTLGLNLPPWDIIGNERVWDGDEDGVAIIDMGAYEFGAPEYVGMTNDELQITSYELSNYPNPFNPTTTIHFETTNLHENAQIEIYNIKGRRVDTIPIYSSTHAPMYSVIWNAKKFSSGVYFYKLVVDGKEMAVKKCLLLK
jgi:predicted outer membrane repeat protein